ncbi:Imm1 family immunity protein [Coleofasciculus sp. H7-2]|uniref:Imm1 family immunity protein n=1 Tax=Coleofasciculus sp. H7-2 TaxID=3351545 RepID=UPI00366AB5BF
MTPEQVRVGTNQIMSYAERQAFWKNSEVGKLLGFDRWPDVEEKVVIKIIFNLSVEKWVGNRVETELIKNAIWSQIEAAIRELDGEIKNLVELSASDTIYMTVGGGKAGKYVATVTFDNLNFHVLVDPSKPDEIEKLVVGGQEGIYPAKMCVDLLRCLLAARTFTETGKLEPLLAWEEDKSLVVV